METINMDITKNKIDSISYDAFYKELIPTHEEFYEPTGKQHYRLLSYLSTLYNNANIIEIGTHIGFSSLSLAYNKTNTIHTFDIFDKVDERIRQYSNIRFYQDDLFEPDTREQFRELILSCPFIFIDVDPHNGNMEYDMFLYLKEIEYPGFIVFDDIWYFKEMRDNFWYKIPDIFRYDLTEHGHWSGTGIVTFNPSIRFPKNDNSNWTLVTSYFNLTKCPDASEEIKNRDANYYFHHAKSTMSLPYNLVVYCDEESIDTIREMRPPHLQEKTEYIIRRFDDFVFEKDSNVNNTTFHEYRQKIIQNRQEKPYHFDNRNTASYYLFCMSRYAILKETIRRNTFQSTHFAWINFCIERMGFSNLVRLDEALSIKRDKFSTCYIDYIPEHLVKDIHEYYRYGRCSMCSGFFTGNAEYMYKVCELIENKFLQYLEQGYGHADEQLYSPVYFENPDLFDHYYGDYNQMITNYTFVYESAERPVFNFIKNSYENKDYERCYRACLVLWYSYFHDKFTIDEYHKNQLFNYLLESKKMIRNFNI
jgi:predicted O-methyltransferase YrrM